VTDEQDLDAELADDDEGADDTDQHSLDDPADSSADDPADTIDLTTEASTIDLREPLDALEVLAEPRLADDSD
jgi:hypothetical protein